jgi:hypothetical protein
MTRTRNLLFLSGSGSGSKSSTKLCRLLHYLSNKKIRIRNVYFGSESDKIFRSLRIRVWFLHRNTGHDILSILKPCNAGAAQLRPVINNPAARIKHFYSTIGASLKSQQSSQAGALVKPCRSVWCLTRILSSTVSSPERRQTAWPSFRIFSASHEAVFRVWQKIIASITVHM